MKTGGNHKERNGKAVIWRSVLLILTSMVLGGNIYLWNARTITGNFMPMPFGIGAAVVLSGSMEPALSVNDLVLIRRTREIEEGDIIVYQNGSELIIHRVIEKDGEMVQTQGDANDTADPPVSISEVKGKMVARIPGIGVLVRALKTPAGVLIVLAAAWLLLELSYRKEKERGAEEIEQIKEEIRRLRMEQEKHDRTD